MPATRTITSLSATITQASLVTAIQTAFTNAGFSTPVSDYTSGTDRILVYSHSSDVGTYSNVFLRVRITSALAVFQQLFATWNTGTNTGTNNSTEVSLGTLASNINIVFNSLNGGSEYRLIILTQGLSTFPLGLIAPNERRGSWTLNSWNWGFIFTNNTFSVLRSTTLNQHASADYDILGAANSRLGTANPQDNERDVLSNLILLSQSNQGFSGRTSDDLGVASVSGSSRYDTINETGTSRQYLVVNPGSGGFVVRIA